MSLLTSKLMDQFKCSTYRELMKNLVGSEVTVQICGVRKNL